MHKLRIGVLRGGGHGYDTSLKTGEVVIRNLPEHFHIDDIFITKDGLWHKDGLEISREKALTHVDLIFNALHGPTVTDGHVQQLFELHRIPFTGSGAFASSISRNSTFFKNTLIRSNLRPIPFKLVQIPTEGEGEELTSLFQTFAPPVIVRPVGSVDGVMIAQNFDQFIEMLEQGFTDADEVLLEEFIPGISANVGIIEGYRDQALYALPPMSQSLLSYEQKKELEELARQVHFALGMRHYSRVDFLISPTRGVYITQAVSHPSLHSESSFHKALATVGAPVSHFLDHITTLALGRK